LAGFFDDAWIDLQCPRCGYVGEVQLLDVRLQRRVFCCCCKVAIHLVDDRASTDVGLRQAEAALRNLGFGA
jgi:hypothetical protein